MTADDEKDGEEVPALLTRRREMFCQEYIRDYNSARAAREAGYSEGRANNTGHEFLKDPAIIARIDELNEEKLAVVRVTRDKITRELANIAYADPSDFVEINGNSVTVKSLAGLTRHQRAAIKEITQTKDGIKIKFHSKEQALELLGRALSMFKDTLNLGNNPDSPLLPQKMIIEVVTAKHERGIDEVPNPGVKETTDTSP